MVLGGFGSRFWQGSSKKIGVWERGGGGLGLQGFAVRTPLKAVTLNQEHFSRNAQRSQALTRSTGRRAGCESKRNAYQRDITSPQSTCEAHHGFRA